MPPAHRTHHRDDRFGRLPGRSLWLTSVPRDETPSVSFARGTDGTSTPFESKESTPPCRPHAVTFGLILTAWSGLVGFGAAALIRAALKVFVPGVTSVCAAPLGGGWLSVWLRGVLALVVEGAVTS